MKYYDNQKNKKVEFNRCFLCFLFVNCLKVCLFLILSFVNNFPFQGLKKRLNLNFFCFLFIIFLYFMKSMVYRWNLELFNLAFF